MRNALREPLLQFLVLGLALFLLFEWRGSGTGSSRVVVTSGQIEQFASGFARTWQRPPTQAELKGLVDEHVKEEIATREAIATGLDRDDTIIRRRLRQKLEFLAEDAADQSPPTDAEVQGWLEAHPEAFRTESQVAFRQVLVSRERRGTGAPAEAERLLTRLRAAGPGADAAHLGDPTMLPAEMQLVPVREVRLTFGDGFAHAIEVLPPGQWSGPVDSAYGLHLVLVTERVAAGKPDLSAIRSEVEREVVTERRRKELDSLYRRLISRYSVTIEMPAPAGTDPVSGGGGSR